MRVCDGPVFNCSDAPDAASCEAMRTELKEDSMASKLWKSIRREGNVHQACIDLGKCDAESDSDCHKALLSDPACKTSTMCSAVEVCSNECYVCNRLVREWPIFMEACKPPSAIIPNEVEEFTIVRKFKYTPVSTLPVEADASFVHADAAAEMDLANHQEADASTAIAHIEQLFAEGKIGEEEYKALLEHQINVARGVSFVEMDAELDVDSENSAVTEDGKYYAHAAFEADPEAFTSFVQMESTVSDGVDHTEQCFALWDELALSRRARYFMSYKKYAMPELNPDDLLQSLAWDAHSVCKCLGKCPTQPGETLSLLNTCKYTRMHELQMRLAFPTATNP